MSILIDSTTLVDGPHDASVIDFGLPIDLPIDTIRRMSCGADITPIIVGADGVKLYLGDTTRLATPDQRRALRAMYRTCAVLAADRTLTITLPDGTVSCHSPPKAFAA